MTELLTGRAGAWLRTAVAPGDRPARYRVLSRIARGQVQGIAACLVHRAGPGERQRGSDVQDRDDQRSAAHSALAVADGQSNRVAAIVSVQVRGHRTGR